MINLEVTQQGILKALSTFDKITDLNDVNLNFVFPTSINSVNVSNYEKWVQYIKTYNGVTTNGYEQVINGLYNITDNPRETIIDLKVLFVKAGATSIETSNFNIQVGGSSETQILPEINTTAKLYNKSACSVAIVGDIISMYNVTGEKITEYIGVADGTITDDKIGTRTVGDPFTLDGFFTGKLTAIFNYFTEKFRSLKDGQTVIVDGNEYTLKDTFESHEHTGVDGTPKVSYNNLSNKENVDKLINLDAVYTATSSNGVDFNVTIPGITSYYDGLEVKIKFAIGANSGYTNININGLGSVSVARANSKNNELLDFLPRASILPYTIKCVEVTVPVTYYQFVAENFKTEYSDIQNTPATLGQSLSTIYVSKSGADTNNGKTIAEPKLTITSAITAASALITAGATRATVNILDSGIYTENITLPNNVDLFAPNATMVGKIDIANSCHVVLYGHYASENSQQMLYKTGTNTSYYSATISDGRGIAGSLNTTINVYNTTAGSILFVTVETMMVASSGSGVREHSSTTGHIHFNIKDLYLTGDQAKGIYASGTTSNIIGYVDHILKLGSPTTTRAIDVLNAGAVVKITANEIIADTAYNITAGSLYINCPVITGTKTGTAIFDSSIAYTLPTASDTVLGGIKVGTNLSITDEVLSATTDPTKLPKITFTGTAVPLDTSHAVYTQSVAVGTTYTFPSTNINLTDNAYTFQLWLNVTAASQSFVFPADFGGETIDTSAISLYIFVFMWCSEKSIWQGSLQRKVT